MNDLEHPDITHVNRTGYTREQWEALHRREVEDDMRDDRSETLKKKDYKKMEGGLL